jgi:nucleoside triphosphate diphosphatase
MKDSNGSSFARAAAIMERLRAPGGCPWDREQTFDSIRRYTLEETYEVFDAIERRDWFDLKEELGDLLLQVLFYAQMAAEAGHFTIDDVCNALSDKLIRRHPHVFGDIAGEKIDSDRVLKNWEALKQQERAAKPAPQADSLLDAVPRNMPSALEAQKLGEKAAKAHFDWPDENGLFAKLEEETAELRAELAQPARSAERISAEAGDLLFTMVNLCRHLGADAELSLRETNARFRRRFRAMEQAAARANRRLDDMSSAELEELWQQAKLSADEFSKLSPPGGRNRVE